MAVALKENQPIFGAEAIAERPDGTRVWSYLHTAVLNLSRSRLRRRLVAGRFRPESVRDADSAETGALGLLLRRDLAVALGALPRRQREAIVLRYYADLSEAQTAAAMGCSAGAVKSHTSRAMTALRHLLEDRP